MTLSAELTRSLADHATAESWAAFASRVGTAPTATNLAAAMNAKGYKVDEAEVVAALEFAKQSVLADHQLDGVVGGQGMDTADFNKIIDDFRMTTPVPADGMAAWEQNQRDKIGQLLQMQVALMKTQGELMRSVASNIGRS